MDSDEYQVTIKSANQKVDDYATKCNPNWTVHRLKQHISETHVNKPSIEEQRLIYAGILLKDSYILKQIFFRDSLCTELTNSSRTDFTIHLVCSSYTQKSLGNTNASSSSNSSNSSSATNSNNGRPTTVNASISAPGDGSGEPTITASTVPRQPIQQQPQASPSNVAPSSPNTIIYSIPVGPITPLTAAQQAEMVRNLLQSDLMRHQMAVFQQLAYVVAAQMATNLANNAVNSANLPPNNNERINQVPLGYMPIVENHVQINQMAATSSTDHITAAAASQMIYNAAAGNRQEAQFVPATDAHEATGNAAGVAHQNENINNESNANQPQPGGFVGQMQAPPAPVVEQPPPPPQPAVDQDIMQRDVIDWVYYSVRAAVLMAALYIHASVFKLLFIVGLLAIAYFFNRRSTRRAQTNNIRQEQQAQQQDQLNVPAAQQPADNHDNAELRRRAAPNGRENPASDDNELTEGAQNRQAGPQRVPFLKLIYLVVTDFLASMVPD